MEEEEKSSFLFLIFNYFFLIDKTDIENGKKERNLKERFEENSVVNISSIFGGITVYVPEDINVKVVTTYKRKRLSRQW